MTSISVLVVENELSIMNLLEDALIEGGFAVKPASSGEEAIALLAQSGADLRALVTNIGLAGKLTGWDVAKRGREINEQLPVIYITGADAHDWASKGVPNSQLMQKPFAGVQVVTAVAQLINAARS